MASTIRRSLSSESVELAATERWRSWPLREASRRSWLAVCGMVFLGAAVWYAGGGWLLAAATVAGLGAASWQLFVPVRYQVDALGLRRVALGRSRLIPWHAVRAYQLRPTGIVLYQREDPAAIDVLQSAFVPYPADADALYGAVREHLTHAVELPPEAA